MLKNSFIRIISIFLIIIFLFTTSIFADEYEYNDVLIYIGGQYQKFVAVTSDNWIPSYGYLDVDASGSTLRLRFQGGTWIDTLVNISSYTINTITATQSGSYLNSTMTGGYQRFTNIVTANFPPVNLYINVSSGNPDPTKLTTPIVQVASNEIYWGAVNNASSYTIRYSDNQYGTGSTNLENSFVGTIYNISQSGYYSVRANGSGNYSNSDWSSYVYCEYTGNNNNSNGITEFFQSIITGFNNAFNTIRSFLSSISTMFGELFSFIPVEVLNILWAVIVIGLILSLL